MYFHRRSDDELTPVRFYREIHSILDHVERRQFFGPLERTVAGDSIHASYRGNRVFSAERTDLLMVSVDASPIFAGALTRSGYEKTLPYPTPSMDNDARGPDDDTGYFPPVF